MPLPRPLSQHLSHNHNSLYKSENANKPIQLFFKTENLQKTGAFKARGACNAVLLAKEKFQDDLNGIVTHSSGNHGQAVAYACSKVINF